MARKKAAAPHFSLSIFIDGEPYLTVVSNKILPQNTSTFGARVTVRKEADRLALATTLCEIAADMAKADRAAKEACQNAAAECIVGHYRVAVHTMADENDDMPF